MGFVCKVVELGKGGEEGKSEKEWEEVLGESVKGVEGSYVGFV